MRACACVHIRPHAPQPRPDRTGTKGGGINADWTSDGVGLDTVRKLATVVGGRARLEMSSDSTTLYFEMPAGPAVPIPASRSQSPASSADGGDAASGDGATEGRGALAPDSTLVCAAVDDSSVMRLADSALFRSMGATESNIMVQGATKAEQAGFVELVLMRKPDLVLLDQHLGPPQLNILALPRCQQHVSGPPSGPLGGPRTSVENTISPFWSRRFLTPPIRL